MKSCFLERERKDWTQTEKRMIILLCLDGLKKEARPDGLMGARGYSIWKFGEFGYFLLPRFVFVSAWIRFAC